VVVLSFITARMLLDIAATGRQSFRIASKIRRLIRLLSVGWFPPSVQPSGACLALGTRMLSKPLNAAEGDTTPGLRLC